MNVKARFLEWALWRLVGRFAGDPYPAGTPYMVGERGPELFVPQMDGAAMSKPLAAFWSVVAYVGILVLVVTLFLGHGEVLLLGLSALALLVAVVLPLVMLYAMFRGERL